MGNGAVKLAVSLQGRQRQTVTVNTAKTSTLPNDHIYAGYKISLLDLNPYPVKGGGTLSNSYVATLMITKLQSK